MTAPYPSWLAFYWRELLDQNIPTLSLGSYANESVLDNTNNILRWLRDVNDSGRIGFVPPGIFMLDPIDFTVDQSLTITGSPGAIFKGIETLTPVSMITFRGGSVRPRFSVRGIEFDNSALPYVPADASGTCLSIADFDGYEILFNRFIAGDSFLDEHGDSGVSINQCTGGLIQGNFAQGQSDLFCYITGASSLGPEDDGGDTLVIGNTAYRCAGFGKANRQSRRVIWAYNRCIECRTGISNGGMVLNPPLLNGGLEFIAIGNMFKKIGSRAITQSGSCKTTAIGNQVCDFGYHPITGAEDGFTYAFLIREPDGIYIGNTFWFEEWSGAGRRAIQLQEETDAGGTYTPTGNLIDGNTIIDAETGIREQSNVTGNSGTNYFKNVATPYDLINVNSTSKYGIRKNDGTVQEWLSALSVGKEDPGTDAEVGVGLLSTGIVRATAEGASPYRANRLSSEGTIFTFLKDGVSRGTIVTTASFGGAAILHGGVEHPLATVAQLQANVAPYAAADNTAVMVYVTDAPAGQIFAVSNGVIWLWVSDKTAV